MRILFRAKRGEFFFEKLKKIGDISAYISDVKKCAFGALFRLRAKFSKKPRTKLGARGRPARRAGLALLFIVQEAARQRAADADEEVGLNLNLTTPTQRVGKNKIFSAGPYAQQKTFFNSGPWPSVATKATCAFLFL